MSWKVWGILGALLLTAAANGGASRPHDPLRDLYRRPSEIPFPDENPFTAAKAELGRTLFFDPMLSGSGSRSCASCHDPNLSWQDGLSLAQGEGPAPLPVRTPTLLNVAWVPKLAWDGKFQDLESVAFGPITSPANMNLTEEALVERLASSPAYVRAFRQAFTDGAINRENIERALATFERTIVSAEAPFDRWVSGDETAIGPDAKRGFAVFNGKARCAECHSGWAFTDSSFHDVGVAHEDDVGRGRLFPTSRMLKHAFKTPTLRDVARRDPYMHDGSVPSLADVIDLYDRGGVERPSRAEAVKPIGLTPGEKRDLIAFLQTLGQ